MAEINNRRIINENIIDLGEWKTPSSWDDITLEQMSELEKLYEEKDRTLDIREYIHILCGKSEDEVNNLPIEFLETIMKKLSFLQTTMEESEPSNRIEIDGKQYVLNTQNKLKVGEYVAADMVIKNDPHDYASILAIVCRLENEPYDSHFENEVLQERIAMFKKQPITKIRPLISFFLRLFVIQESFSQLYTITEEMLNRTATTIESSQNVGRLRKWRMKRRMKALQKSLESMQRM